MDPFFKSKYATLDAIQHHIKPYLHKNGLVVTQVNIIAGEQGFVQTNVWHTESGETSSFLLLYILMVEDP